MAARALAFLNNSSGISSVVLIRDQTIFTGRRQKTRRGSFTEESRIHWETAVP